VRGCSIGPLYYFRFFIEGDDPALMRLDGWKLRAQSLPLRKTAARQSQTLWRASFRRYITLWLPVEIKSSTILRKTSCGT
jgi:hypothetical protein